MAKDERKKKGATEYINRTAKITPSKELAFIPQYEKTLRVLQDKLVPPHLRAMKELEEKYRNVNVFTMSPIFDGYKKFEVLTPAMQKSFHSLDEIAKMVNAITINLTDPFPNPEILKIFKGFKYDDLSWCEYDLDDANEEDIEPEKKVEIIRVIPSLIKSIYDDQDLLHKIEPRQFEEIIAELLYKKGFEVELTKQTRDGGYDILALSTMGGSTFKTLVECKRYTNTVGVGLIRGFCHVIQKEKANKGIIFTTSYFSSEARKMEGEEGSLLDLRDRSDLIQWVNDYCRNTSQ